MTDILLVAVAPELEERVMALPGHQVVTIDRGGTSLPDSVSSEAEFMPDLILVGSGVRVDTALEYAGVILETYPDIAVALVAEPDRGIIRRATKIGIRGVLRPSVTERELASLIERAGTDPEVPPGDEGGASSIPHVIVVASPKGGVGKTTLATNLCVLLARRAPHQVVLVDLDLQFGDVANVLDLDAEYTITSALAGRAQDALLLKTLLSRHDAGFFVLCGADSPADNGQVNGDDVRKVISQLAGSFRYVVVDTSAGLLEETLASLEEATDLVLVSTLDVSALRAARKEVEVLNELSLLPSRRHVVINRADRRTGLTIRDAEKIMGIPVDVVLPDDDLVTLANNRGEPFVSGSSKRNGLRKALSSLEAKVADSIGSRSGPVHKGVDVS